MKYGVPISEHTSPAGICAGAITVRVHDTASGVSRFAPELKRAVRREIEFRAGELQLTDTSGPLLHQNLDGAVVTQRRAGSERVAPMEIR